MVTWLLGHQWQGYRYDPSQVSQALVDDASYCANRRIPVVLGPELGDGSRVLYVLAECVTPYGQWVPPGKDSVWSSQQIRIDP